VFAAIALPLGVCVNALTPAGVPLWPAAGQHAAVPSAVWQEIKFADVSAVGPGAVLVDVRESRDYAAAHPLGAVNLPYRQFNAIFPSFRSTVKPRARIFLYCYGSECGTSLRVANRLVQSGFTDVTIIRGGFEAWKSSGQATAAGGAASG
jgi:rhodanese-related sulfurtransferase